MQRKSLATSQCPIARSVERVGERWNILILREAHYGVTRFDEFQERLQIAPNILTSRLTALVGHGLLVRRRYSERPPRYEYCLTESGEDFRAVVQSILAWGNRHFAPEGTSVAYVNRETGELADPVLVDRVSGRPMSDRAFEVMAGPAANDRTRARLERARGRPAPDADTGSTPAEDGAAPAEARPKARRKKQAA